jgi:hypothetical protein
MGQRLCTRRLTLTCLAWLLDVGKSPVNMHRARRLQRKASAVEEMGGRTLEF